MKISISQQVNNQRGAVLATVIIMGTVIGILAITTFRFVDMNTKQTGHLTLRREAQYTARSGLEATLYGLRNKKSDTIEGIIAPNGNPAGFEDTGTMFLDVDTVTFGSKKVNKLNRRTAEIKVEIMGKTQDNLRNRYKITSKTQYV